MTETTTEQSIEDRIDTVVEDLRSILQAIETEGAESLEEATSQSWENVRRFNAAAAALEDDAARVDALHREREELPVSHSRAILADDEEEAQRLKARFGELEAELAAIEERRPRLEAKVLELGGKNAARLPRHLRSDGALLHQQTAVTRSLDATFRHLATLNDEVVAKVKSTTDKFKLKASEAASVQSEVSTRIFHDTSLAQERRETTRVHVNPARTAARSR